MLINIYKYFHDYSLIYTCYLNFICIFLFTFVLHYIGKQF